MDGGQVRDHALAVVNVNNTDDAVTLNCPDTSFKELAHCWTLGNPDMNACNEPVQAAGSFNTGVQCRHHQQHVSGSRARAIAIYQLELR